jgi:hypothetical protein
MISRMSPLIRVYSVVHAFACLGVLILAIAGCRQALAYDLAPNVLIRRCAIAALATSVLFQAFLPTSKLVQLWRISFLISILAALVFLRYQLLPYEYISPRLGSAESVHQAFEAFSATNRIGNGATMAASSGVKLEFYKSMGDADIPPLLLPLGLPLSLMFINLAIRRIDAASAQS